MNTIKFASNTIKMVNAPEASVMEQYLHVLLTGETDELQEIGHGACGTVFKLSEKYVLKLNNRYMSETGDCKDGQILEALQGLPLIPTLYAYTEDNYATLIQLIDGETVSNVRDGNPAFLERFNKEYDAMKNAQKIIDFHNGATERGWIAYDLHNENCMLDVNGDFWVVDVGLFQKLKETSWVHSPDMLFNHVNGIALSFNKDLIPVEELSQKCKTIKPEKSRGMNFFTSSYYLKFTTPDSNTYSTSKDTSSLSMRAIVSLIDFFKGDTGVIAHLQEVKAVREAKEAKKGGVIGGGHALAEGMKELAKAVAEAFNPTPVVPAQPRPQWKVALSQPICQEVIKPIHLNSFKRNMLRVYTRK